MAKPLVISTYAPAGLGHLRVLDALMEVLPADFDSIVFSPSDETIESLHRIASQNILARKLMEWFQHGTPQTVFTKKYRNFLKNNVTDLFLEFTSLVKSQKTLPKTVIIVSTHFGLSHQLGVIKERLEKYLDIKIYLVVQVTDDSPQYIWYVDSADLIIVPSEKTAQKLQVYGKKEGLREVEFKVLPYPVIPSFSNSLSESKVSSRQDQYNPKSDETINIAIPISGAAVGMNFFIQLIENLRKLSNRFNFYIVCREAPFTKNFINKIKDKNYINVFISENYQEVVHMYNSVYQNNVISSEITKPSEQSFKALLDTKSIGGSFLFFAKPIGRQEYDNLNFLRRNNFLSSNLRATILPEDPIHCAKFIHRTYQSGFLLKAFKKFKSAPDSSEIGDNGAVLFWQTVTEKFIK